MVVVISKQSFTSTQFHLKGQGEGLVFETFKYMLALEFWWALLVLGGVIIFRKWL